HALEVHAEHTRHRGGEQGLRGSGPCLEQDVAAAKRCDQQKLDGRLLAENNLRDFLLDSPAKLRDPLDAGCSGHGEGFERLLSCDSWVESAHVASLHRETTSTFPSSYATRPSRLRMR